MRICVMGLWHLGCVTAACMAKLGADVTGLTEDKQSADALNNGQAPLHEPGLDAMIREGVERGKLRFTSDMASSISGNEYIWVCYDTPVDEDDNADEEFVINKICSIADFIRENQGILVSSQLSVGSIRKLEKYFKEKGKSPRVAYSPENLRLGKAIEVFLNPDRIIAGVRDEKSKEFYQPLLGMISMNIVWMSPESAEMTKHAINSFLATSVVFINEIAAICESVGADADEVSRGLLSESRIGPKAYLKPGNAFAGGTLARDIKYLIKQAEEHGVNISQIKGTKESNDHHKVWTFYKVEEIVGNLARKSIFVLGLTYKAGTNTLRRSLSIEMIDQLENAGALVTAYDPDIIGSQENRSGNWKLAYDIPEKLDSFDAIVIMSNKDGCLNEIFMEKIEGSLNIPVIDENGYLKNTSAGKRENYYTIGRG